MKILLVNKFLFPKGGAEISTLATGDLLASKGHQVNYWGMDHPSNPDYPLKDHFICNVDFYKSRGIKKQFVMAANLLYSIEARQKIEKVLADFKQISPSILDVFRQYKIPVVMTMRDFKMVCPVYSLLNNNKPCEKCKNGMFYNCIINKCSKNSYSKSVLSTVEMYLHHNVLHVYDAIHTYISPSKFLMAKCIEMGFKHRVVHLPNFVNIDNLSSDYAVKGARAVYFGRLSTEKGIFTLLHAFRGLDAHLDIIGDGPSKDAMIEEARVLNMGNIQFHGHISGEALYDRIKAATVVIIPSEIYENNPRSAIEAFALGKPVIGSKIGGIPELVQDHVTGLTFTPWDSGDLREKVKWLFSNPDAAVEMGKNGRKLVETELSPENHYVKLMSIYNSAINSIYKRRT
jgi:glycosyltransferase involved in cell wall biosynthesis